MSKSIKRGFESSGIIPVDAQKIIIKLIPAGRNENLDHSALADSFSEIINKATNVKERIATKRSKKINIIAGKSISLVDLRARSSASESNQILDDIQTTSTEEHSDTELSETEENENSETDENCSIEQSETEQTETQDLKVPVTKICDILQDSFVIVSFVYNTSTKIECTKCFVAKVTKINTQTLTVDCLRPFHDRKNKFIYPDVRDINIVKPSQILFKLSGPVSNRGIYTFAGDVS
ncbi:hypothetical protein CBL_12832 [Carabus blaptoides fortunei]